MGRNEEISFLKSLKVLCWGSMRHTVQYMKDKKKLSNLKMMVVIALVNEYPQK